MRQFYSHPSQPGNTMTVLGHVALPGHNLFTLNSSRLKFSTFTHLNHFFFLKLIYCTIVHNYVESFLQRFFFRARFLIQQPTVQSIDNSDFVERAWLSAQA